MSTKGRASRARARIQWRSAAIGRPFASLLVLCALLAWMRGEFAPCADCGEPDPSVATAAALGRLGYVAKPEDIHWVDPPNGRKLAAGSVHRFVALAQFRNELTDVWLGRARHSPEGRWLGLGSIHNLSDTSAVAETALTVSGERVAWSVNNDADTLAVQVADMRGRRLPTDGEMTFFERLQTRLTFLQETGQFAGICRQAFRFKSPQPGVTFAWTDNGLEVQRKQTRAMLSCDGAAATELDLVAEPTELGAPGDLVTWAVDRARALPWIGANRIQWLKAVAFGWLDRVETLKHQVVRQDVAAEVKAEIGEDLTSAPSAPAADPITGWPPQAMTPILTPPIQGEGVFRPLDDDPFAVRSTGARSPFALSFLRPDANQPDCQLFVLVWDPRLLELHTMTGTREPKTATGETGSGMVPRDDATIGRLAAAFNGGFQATHGEFGMMAERIVYLPPKPYAATVAELADGTVGFGTWPQDEAIGDSMVGFRQNLTPLVADGQENPYRRTWWGGVPAGWQDATRTVRTGLCLTQEDFVAYFYGSSLSAQHLMRAMTSARCRYGVHLDMNPGHTGLELYRVGRSGTLPNASRKLEANWQTTGTVPGAPTWEFLGRRLLRSMHLMHFPRYVRTDSRDFFYLTHRYVLPPEASATAESKTETQPGQWQLPNGIQHGYPPVVATRRLRIEPARPELDTSVTVLDAKWLMPCSSDCDSSAAVVRISRTTAASGVGIYYYRRGFVVAPSSPHPDALPIIFGKDEAHTSKAVAAVGVAHGSWLYYAELTRGSVRSRDTMLLKRVLSSLDCAASVYLDQPLALTLGDVSRAGESQSNVWTFVRNDAPMVQRLFNETPVVAPAIWQPLQAKRVRYARQRPGQTHPEAAVPSDLEAESTRNETTNSPTD